MLTEREKREIIRTLNDVFLPPKAVKVVGENENAVRVLYEDGRITEWEKSDFN